MELNRDKREALHVNAGYGLLRERWWKECKQVVLLPHYHSNRLSRDRKGSAVIRAPARRRLQYSTNGCWPVFAVKAVGCWSVIVKYILVVAKRTVDDTWHFWSVKTLETSGIACRCSVDVAHH